MLCRLDPLYDNTYRSRGNISVLPLLPTGAVTAARDPGRVTAILYSRLATSLRSLAIILLYSYTYYHSLVLATGPNSRAGSGYGSTRNRTVATGLTTRKTRPIGNGPVFPQKPGISS